MNTTIARLLRCEGRKDDPFADFRNFLAYLFIEVRHWEVGAIQYDIADFMQNLPVCKDGKARGQVQSMRGAGKTEIACAFCLWLLYLNPDTKILVISSVLQKAQEFVNLARQLIDATPLLEHLKPHLAKDGLVTKDQKDNTHGFVVGAVTAVSKELSLASFPIYGTYTGSHPDVVVADDVETPENSLTVGKRDKLMSKVYEFENLVNPGGITLIQGTPQSEDSIYMKLGTKSYSIRRWPARAPALDDESGTVNVAPWILQQVKDGLYKPGDPTFSERVGEDQLQMKMAVYGPTMFALQMMLDTNLADADRYPLRLRDLIVMDTHPEMAPESVLWGTANKLNIDPQGLPGDCYYGPAYRGEKYAPYQTGVMFIDPKGRGADTVGYAVVKALNGVLYAVEVGGLAQGKGNDGAADSVMQKLARIAFKHQIKKVVVEGNFGDGMYLKLLAPVMARANGPTELKEVNSKGQKELRILDILEPLTANHKLVVTPQVAANDALMYQYTRITRLRGCLRHDDLIEALAAACAELKDIVSLDPDKQEAVAKAREQKAMVDSFRKNAIGFVFGQPDNASKKWGRWARKK